MGRVQFPTKQPMPGNVRTALEKRKMIDANMERPAYQKDEYLKWIALAVGPLEKQKRLEQMLDELDKGGVFKGEPWTPPPPVTPEKPETPTAKPEKPAAKAAAKAPEKPVAKPGKPAAKAGKGAAK
jgi:hypothetical protein